MTPETFDAIIIGTGQAGKPLAIALATPAGRPPSSSASTSAAPASTTAARRPRRWSPAARVAYLARRAADYGVHTGGDVRVNMARGAPAQARRGRAASATAASAPCESTPNVELHLRRGAASPTRRRCEVTLNAGGERLLTAPNDRDQHRRPARGAADPGPRATSASSTRRASWNSRRLPSHLLVLGGGYIGLEFGQMFRRFGAA